MLRVLGLVEGPDTNVIEGFDALSVEGCNEPYPPALTAAESAVVNPVVSVCCA
jgi:hypothetical protein